MKKIKLFIVGKLGMFTDYIRLYMRPKTPESKAYFKIIEYLSKNAVSKHIDISTFLKNNFIWDGNPHELLTTMQNNGHISFIYSYDQSQNQNTQASITVSGMEFYSSIVTNQSVIETNKTSRKTFIIQTLLLFVTTITSFFSAVAAWLMFKRTTNDASLRIYQEPLKNLQQPQTDKSKSQSKKLILQKKELKKQK